MFLKKFYLPFAIGALLLFSGAAFSQPPNLYTFSGDVDISESAWDSATTSLFESSGQHYVAYRGDTVYVVWWESRSSPPPSGSHVFFAKSTDGGQTFGPNIRVNSTPSGFNPSMKVDTGGIIYVAYQRLSDIYFTKSTDGGTTFTPAILVVDSAGLSAVQEKPAIAVNNGGQVFVVWIDRRINPRSIFTSASFDGGITFGLNVNVDPVLRDRDYPDIIADDSGRVYVGYAELLPNVRQIALARSSDSGITFDFHTFVSDIPSDGSSCCGVYTSMTCNGRNQVGIAWSDSRSNQVTLRFSISSDFGQTFSPSVRVEDDSDLNSESGPVFPSLFWRDGMFYISWTESRLPSGALQYATNIFFSYSFNQGQSFVASRQVTNFSDTDLVSPNQPSVAVNEEARAFLAWIDNRPDPRFQIYWRIFGSGGTPALIKGDLNFDGLLTATDIVLELNAVFLGLSFPAPEENGDGDCDGQLTPTDVVLLLNATFLGTPFPCN